MCSQFSKRCASLLATVFVVVVGITFSLVFFWKGHKSALRGNYSAIVANGRGCAEIGGKILEDGGSAVDAAIVTLLCEGVMQPHLTGIGGGFVGTIYTKSKREIETILARETAPSSAYKYMFTGKDNISGAIAAAVPGEILGYWELHRRYGRLPWGNLFKPVIDLCYNGHYVSKYLAAALWRNQDYIRNEPSMAEVFLKNDGAIYREGDILRRKQLGKTFKKISKLGPSTMYSGGEIGKLLIDDLTKLGGTMKEQDLRNYRVRWGKKEEDIVFANITGGYTLYTTPLPTSGALLAFILNVISEMYTDRYDIYWQRIIEAFKYAYAQRTKLGDPVNSADMASSIHETYNNLISKDFAKKIHDLIQDDKTHTDIKYYGAKSLYKKDHGSSNIAVLHQNGDAVVITSSLNNEFGGKVISHHTGIIMNDQMNDFSTLGSSDSFEVLASPANYIKSNKMPMSSMSPAIILDKKGNVAMLVGAAGGTRITTSVATAIIKYLILNETLDKAVNDGRLHHQLSPMQISVEREVPVDIREYLQRVGHKIELTSARSNFAALTAIGTLGGETKPFYDRRRVGSVAVIDAKS